MSKEYIDDLNKIKSIKFKYPEFQNKNTEDKIIEMHNTIIELEDGLYLKRREVWDIETKLNNLKSEFNKLTSIVDIEFEKKSFDIINNENNIMIINPKDARNKNY